MINMEKGYLFIPLTFAIAISCQKNAVPENDYLTNRQNGDIEIAYETKSEGIINEPVCFSAEKDFESWVKIIGLKNRLSACDVPISRCDSLTTEALVKSIIHYPLNYIVTAYNNPQDAIDIFFEHSTLHKELLNRRDAAIKLVEFYSMSLPSLDTERDVFDDNYRSLPLVNELALGYLLLSDKIDYGDKRKAFESFKNEISSKYHKIVSEPHLYGKLAAGPLTVIVNNYIKTSLLTKSGGDFLSFTTIYTPIGQSLQGMLISEFDDAEILSYNNTITTNHPDAIIRGSASATYNCHGYAWHLSPTENTVWLNSETFWGDYQLNKYWTYDKYRSTTSAYAEKVHYPNGDHSALVLPNGNYISKWGPGPLMEHSPTDCPYDTSSINYYCQKEIPLIDDPTVSIDGPYLISPNVSYNYYVQYPVNWLSYTITAESWLSDNTITMTRIGNYNATLQISVSGYGPYDIIVKGYAGSTLYSTDTYTFACVGEMTARHIQEHQITDIRSYLEEHLDTISQ